MSRIQPPCSGLARGGKASHELSEGIGVVQRQVGKVVTEMQMSDDIVARPLLELGFSRPALLIERFENPEERVAFVAKVYRLLNHVGDYLTFDFKIDCGWLQTARIRSRAAQWLGISRYSGPLRW